jgi:hypothetical protein
MNEPEAFKLLTLASARDGRTVTQAVAKVWASDLDRVYLEDAVEALTMHYRESTAWAMPGHIIANVRRVREARERDARVRRALEPVVPNVISDEGLAIYRAELARIKGLS